MSDGDTMEQFIQQNQHRPSLLKTLAEAFRELWRKLTGKERTQAEEAAYRLEKAYEKAVEAQRKAEKKNTAQTGGGERLSLRKIVGENGKNYGIGVYLDSTLLDNLSPAERRAMVKEYVRELGGQVLTAYDEDGNEVNITIAEADKKFTNRQGKKVAVNHDLVSKYDSNVKQEAIALVDELVMAAEFDTEKESKYSHGWIDDNGKNHWKYWKTYIQDKNNTIWLATLNVATAEDGTRILYDINPIKKVGQAVKSATLAPYNQNVSQSSPDVNTKLSTKEQQFDAQTDTSSRASLRTDAELEAAVREIQQKRESGEISAEEARE